MFILTKVRVVKKGLSFSFPANSQYQESSMVQKNYSTQNSVK